MEIPWPSLDQFALEVNCEQPSHGGERLLMEVFPLLLNQFLEGAIRIHALYKFFW